MNLGFIGTGVIGTPERPRHHSRLQSVRQPRHNLRNVLSFGIEQREHPSQVRSRLGVPALAASWMNFTHRRDPKSGASENWNRRRCSHRQRRVLATIDA
jgi:hypothetical protein